MQSGNVPDIASPFTHNSGPVEVCHDVGVPHVSEARGEDHLNFRESNDEDTRLYNDASFQEDNVPLESTPIMSISTISNAGVKKLSKE